MRSTVAKPKAHVWVLDFGELDRPEYGNAGPKTFKTVDGAYGAARRALQGDLRRAKKFDNASVQRITEAIERLSFVDKESEHPVDMTVLVDTHTGATVHVRITRKANPDA